MTTHIHTHTYIWAAVIEFSGLKKRINEVGRKMENISKWLRELKGGSSGWIYMVKYINSALFEKIKIYACTSMLFL